ncbi:LuxR C-terminal-related transcriptional regulator [Citrobacter koseri]|uniref:LuxR C-terminal-related transcriptional regulator n=1 Tax=Citrobacter koseri TaxID=545 RepID=UPI0023AED062|nr:LuxR C-terminal-related transcriptional regulator [Citrobacter koseri]
MLIVSENNYLRLGLMALLESKNITKSKHLIFFDTGKDNFIILDTTQTDMSIFSDPLISFSHCRHKSVSKKISLKEIHQQILTPPKMKKFKNQEILTPSEQLVMKKILTGLNQRSVAQQLKRSYKTINNHKINALKKMGGGRRHSVFFSEYAFWRLFWGKHIYPLL